MKALLTLSLILSLFIFCDTNEDPSHDAVNNSIIFYGSLLQWEYEYKKTDYHYIDKKDGTVELNIIRRGDNASLGTIAILKKCLQGQVYRKEENDCKGTGSESDYYGAQQLQFCDKLDYSCTGEDYTLNGNGNSEAYKSCDAETLLGRKWKVIRGKELNQAYIFNYAYKHIREGTKIWYRIDNKYDSNAIYFLWKENYYYELKT
ncbi:MAG: hypothetical protein KDK45_19910, partial [Leptospiraceae bacterium]|nr:hypothetical protein [Leptospiraceae bacterium]